MTRDEKPTPKHESDEDWDQTGLCEEAQADGIPCYELGRECEKCERARPPLPKRPSPRAVKTSPK